MGTTSFKWFRVTNTTNADDIIEFLVQDQDDNPAQNGAGEFLDHLKENAPEGVTYTMKEISASEVAQQTIDQTLDTVVKSTKSALHELDHLKEELALKEVEVTNAALDVVAFIKGCDTSELNPKELFKVEHTHD